MSETAQAFGPAEAGRIARALVHTGADAAFGTLDKGGGPNVSHVAAATLVSGSPLILISDLALHTHNVRRDPRASLLYVEARAREDTNARARLTVTGTVSAVPDSAAARDRFLRRHPSAELYIDFADMHLMRFDVERAHLVAGFGKITNVASDALQTAPADALADIDKSACEHMNDDHADALEAIAVAEGGGRGAWRAVGIDPLGIDLSDGAFTLRAEYARPVDDPGALRHALKALADAARAQIGSSV